jgi:hypothetical protein
VTVTDRTSGAKKMLVKKIEVLPRTFGIIQAHLTADNQGQIPSPPHGFTGQSLYVNFAVVGFDRDRTRKTPNIGVEMSIVDEDGKPTLAKPFAGEAGEGVPSNFSAVPMQFLLNLNRAGKFTLKLKATDRITKKTADVSIPLTVTDVR